MSAGSPLFLPGRPHGFTPGKAFPSGEQGRADAPAARPLFPLRVIICSFPVVVLRFSLMVFLIFHIFWLPVVFTDNSRDMAPSGSPSVPAGSSSLTPLSGRAAPAKLRRTPAGFGPDGLSLMAKVNSTACCDRSGRAASTVPAGPGLFGRNAVPPLRVCAFCLSGDDHPPDVLTRRAGRSTVRP